MVRLPRIVKLKKFANEVWPNMRLGHSIWGVDTKYECANPDGPVDNSDCPEEEPFCNCPCQELIPDSESQLNRINAEIHGTAGPDIDEDGNPIEGTEGQASAMSISPDDLKEPTDEELKELLEATKECSFFPDAFGENYEDWMGCLWNDQENPSSCDCPCVGKKFGDYLEYTRANATYWDTPKYTGMWRNAQMLLLNAQKCVIVIDGDFSLQPGIIISLNVGEPSPDGTELGEWEEHRVSGRWLVHGIEHVVYPTTHRMFVLLMRDSCSIDPNEYTKVSGLFGDG